MYFAEIEQLSGGAQHLYKQTPCADPIIITVSTRFHMVMLRESIGYQNLDSTNAIYNILYLSVNHIIPQITYRRHKEHEDR